MNEINIAINTRNTYLRESLIFMINELICRSANLQISFSYTPNDYLDKDIIIAEVLPGEIYLCNTSLKNRKPGSSVIILHSYDQLPEKKFIVNCLQGVIFVSIKRVNVDEMFAIIAHELKKSEAPSVKQQNNSAPLCTHCPHKMLSRAQVAVANGIVHGFDLIKISALRNVTPRTITWHKNKIMEKYSLNNHSDFFQFINLLKQRW